MKTAGQRAVDLLNLTLNTGDEEFDELPEAVTSSIGYTHYYLCHKAIYDVPNTETVVSLVKCDLELGLELGEIVFECCRFVPDKRIVKGIIDLHNGDNKEVKIKKILEYVSESRLTCLTSFLQDGKQYIEDTFRANHNVLTARKKFEDTILYLLELGQANCIDTVKLVNVTSEAGFNLLGIASIIWEKLAKFLTTINVKANCIDCYFQGASFKVSRLRAISVIESIIIKFPTVRKYLLQNGANPHIIGHDGQTTYDVVKVQYLPFTPKMEKFIASLPKSIYFTIDGHKCRCHQLPCSNHFFDSWHYSNGVFNGHFTRIIGSGGEGVVIEGWWCGKPAAYKFVPITSPEIKIQSFPFIMDSTMKNLEKTLNESRQLNGAQVDSVVTFYGHFRYVCYFSMIFSKCTSVSNCIMPIMSSLRSFLA